MHEYHGRTIHAGAILPTPERLQAALASEAGLGSLPDLERLCDALGSTIPQPPPPLPIRPDGTAQEPAPETDDVEDKVGGTGPSPAQAARAATTRSAPRARGKRATRQSNRQGRRTLGDLTNNPLFDTEEQVCLHHSMSCAVFWNCIHVCLFLQVPTKHTIAYSTTL